MGPTANAKQESAPALHRNLCSTRQEPEVQVAEEGALAVAAVPSHPSAGGVVERQLIPDANREGHSV